MNWVSSFDGARPVFPTSVWRDTAQPCEPLAPLQGDVETEVAIVGAGFTGLAAAHHLLGRSVDTVVLEARDAGWGASGRTGALVVPRYKTGFARLSRVYGDATARELHRLILEAVELLAQTIDAHNIRCEFQRNGHITAAHGPAALAALIADAQWLAANGDAAIRILGREEMKEQIGSTAYCGGYLDVRGGSIHPLDYCNGLARALQKKGVPIFVGTQVLGFDRTESSIVLRTNRARVRAKRVIFATNAYTEGSLPLGDLNRRIAPVSSSVIATVPLRPELRETLLSAGRPVSDTKHLLNYFRILENGQFVFGGRGDITGRSDDAKTYQGIERALVEIFPQLENVGIANRWSGMVAVTLDDFPHLGWIDDRILFALGYGGRGMALTSLMGKYLAAAVCGEAVELGPMTAPGFRPIPFHALRIPVMTLMAAYYRYKDKHAVR